MNKTLLFVYGTLKRGLASHHLISDQEFVGEATTMPLYRLYGVSWHPGMVPDRENGLDIRGELWLVDAECLAKLDEFEGVPDSFVRSEVVVRDTFQPVQAYFYNLSIPPDCPSGGEWPLPS
jgi:gamma-glutamylcyclotransferase (GGCT)/AIG2-like uncharacterized protein YtfP